MSGNYPPGVGPNTRNAPWNDPGPEPCPECNEEIRREEDHENWCDLSGIGEGELRDRLAEDAEIEKAEMRMEERRLERD